MFVPPFTPMMVLTGPNFQTANILLQAPGGLSQAAAASFAAQSAASFLFVEEVLQPFIGQSTVGLDPSGIAVSVTIDATNTTAVLVLSKPTSVITLTFSPPVAYAAPNNIILFFILPDGSTFNTFIPFDLSVTPPKPISLYLPLPSNTRVHFFLSALLTPFAIGVFY
jgi:hypothetical protein